MDVELNRNDESSIKSFHDQIVKKEERKMAFFHSF